MPSRDGERSENLGGQVVMRRAAAARWRLLFWQNLGGTCALPAPASAIHLFWAFIKIYIVGIPAGVYYVSHLSFSRLASDAYENNTIFVHNKVWNRIMYYLKLWQNKNGLIFVRMLVFHIFFWIWISWLQQKKDMQKPSIPTKALLILSQL